MLKDLFLGKKPEPAKASLPHQPTSIPDQMWVKCPGCGRLIYDKILTKNLKVCPLCNFHLPLTARERIECTFDPDTFSAMEYDIPFSDPLHFPDYQKKAEYVQKKSGLTDAVVCGTGKMHGITTACCIMDNAFMMGSMGYIVGESITRLVEYATAEKLPLIIFTTSGGARMQEGIVSLMQMAKVSGALKRHGDAGLLYITVITHPTTGGVTASFASLGDIIIAEQGALLGFAGRRVIEQTIKQKLPKNFQTAEFALEHGFVDTLCKRKRLQECLYQILHIHEAK